MGTRGRGGGNPPPSPAVLPLSRAGIDFLERGGVAVATRSQLGRRFIDLLDLPPDVVLDLPKLTLTGDCQLSLENHRGIIEYSPEQIRVSTNRGEIQVKGVDLVIKSIAKEEISLAGRITSVDLVDWGVS